MLDSHLEAGGDSVGERRPLGVGRRQRRSVLQRCLRDQHSEVSLRSIVGVTCGRRAASRADAVQVNAQRASAAAWRGVPSEVCLRSAVGTTRGKRQSA